ncbi:MAG: iron-containing redox enzyme family protein [Acidimicrobiales bacterium]
MGSCEGRWSGTLASFEMNSVGPMGRYSAWLASLGVPPDGRRFYDVHVEADAVHQHIAVDDLVGGLLASEPDLADEVLFGSRAVGLVERAFSDHVLGSWARDRSSLRCGSTGSDGRGVSADPDDAGANGAQLADDYDTMYGGIFDASSNSSVRGATEPSVRTPSDVASAQQALRSSSGRHQC